MWNNFWSVIQDLFWFAVGSHSQTFFTVQSSPIKISPSPVSLALDGPVVNSDTTDNRNFFVSAPEKLATAPIIILPPRTPVPISETESTSTPIVDILYAPVVMYVNNPLGTNCQNLPLQDFDCVIEKFPYGTAVTVIGYDGRYASVNRSNINGWVHKDDLTPVKVTVWPEFTPGQEYDSDNPEVIKMRFLSNDIFGAGSIQLPLQPGEYVMFRLFCEHRNITWSFKRPRVAGAWQRLLKGTKGIHIGVTPKTDSVMEWLNPDGSGRLGYVEAVSPDKTITLSAVGLDQVGRYVVKTFTEEEWKELRPVFIEVA